MTLRTLSIAALAAIAAASLSAAPQIGPISASGWPLCAVPQFSSWPECINFTPTSPHGYLIMVIADPGATRLHYSVTAVLTRTGEAVTLSGDFDVTVSAGQVTAIPVVFNGVIDPDPLIKVTDYAPLGSASTMPAAAPGVR